MRYIIAITILLIVGCGEAPVETQEEPSEVSTNSMWCNKTSFPMYYQGDATPELDCTTANKTYICTEVEND